MKKLATISVLGALCALLMVTAQAQVPGFPQLYNVSLEIVGQGSITVDPDQPDASGAANEYTENSLLFYGDPNSEGISIACTASEAIGWRFSHWELGPLGSETNESQNPTTLDLVPGGGSPSQWTLRAVFVRVYTLTVNIVGTGTVTANPNLAEYAEGTVVDLAPQPGAGWSFDGWSGDLTGSDNPASITMDSNKNVTATFTEDPATYTLTVNVVGTGTVTRDPDLAEYAEGTVVDLTPQPGAGWSFDGWSGDLTGSDNPASITMDSNKTVTATFTQDPATYTLAVNIVGAGTVAKNPDLAEYAAGATVELTAQPAAGWSFVEWSGDLTGSSSPTSITMDSEKTVTATFCTSPAAPSNAHAAAVAADEITLAWTDNATTESGFRIYRSETRDSRDPTPLGETGPNTESFVDDSVECGVLYHYSVVAFNDCGESAAAQTDAATPDCVDYCWETGSIPLIANGSGADLNGRFGVAAGSILCADAGDIQGPPPSFAPSTTLRFALDGSCPGGGDFAYLTNIQAPAVCGEARVWDLRVVDDGPSQTVTLSWDLSGVQLSACAVSLILTDLETGDQTNMLVEAAYEYTKAGNPEARLFTVQLLCAQPVCPDADAGPDRQVHVGTTVTVDAGGSTSASYYRWTFVSRPAQSVAVLSDPNAIAPTFVADLCGEYTLELWVQNDGCWDSDRVTVIAGNTRPNAPNLGPDQTHQVPDDDSDGRADQPAVIQLSGQGNGDADGDAIAAWSWEWVEWPGQEHPDLSTDDVADPTFTADLLGRYVLRARVSDGRPCDSWSLWEEIVVELVGQCSNHAPHTPSAGPDQMHTAADSDGDGQPDQVVHVQLQGTANGDPDSDQIVEWIWEWVDWPGRPATPSPILSASGIANPSFDAPDYGTYVLRFQVGDGRGCNALSEWDPITVTVQLPILFSDDMESGVNGWTANGMWRLVEGTCCPNLPSETHVWAFGRSGGFIGSGSATTPAFDVSGLAAIDVEFWVCQQLSATYWYLDAVAEASFDGGPWQVFWTNGESPSGAWAQVGPRTVDVPAGSTTAQIRIRVTRSRGMGCFAIDDVLVTSSAPAVMRTLTVTSDGCCAIDVDGDGQADVAPGTTQTFQVPDGTTFVLMALPGECCEITGWTVDGTPVDGNPIQVDVNADRTAICVCAPITHVTLTVTADDGAGVDVDGDGQADVAPGTTETFQVPCGDECTLQALPDVDHRFSHWLVDGQTVDANPSVFTMNADRTVESFCVDASTGQELFFDDMESGVNGWTTEGMWQQVEGTCCPNLPSETHAWGFGRSGGFIGTGFAATPTFDVSGLAAIDVEFWVCQQLTATYWYLDAVAEASFDGGPWQVFWTNGESPSGAWAQVGPRTVNVPAGSTTAQIRIRVTRSRGMGCFAIDDLRVVSSVPNGRETMVMIPADVDSDAPAEFVIESVGNEPNPVRDVHTTRFSVMGRGIDEIRVNIYDQTGSLVFDSGWQPNGYDWHVESDTGEVLANGIYLYQVLVRGLNGEVLVTQTKKLAVYR